ncbi:hypothetical protein FIU93_28895 (plasmid) [Labrenzia sp. THAF35]|uniref:hypothetical protein n=1 Tax=Labrenzia sp. THAF35 TaxID=2587854 RepID=UPI001269395B|nr:hypothetical protein [Labrenzia sp. THAF35]QFT70838.1 hypothetical protein FIU93_28895 [Labrenzia sp. THAF35]
MREEIILSARVEGYSANRQGIASEQGPDGRTGKAADASDITQVRTSIKLRLAVGSETYCRASIHLARETHLRTIFRDFRFSEFKARAIFDKAMVAPERVGLIDAVPGADVRRRAITSALITIRLKGSRLTNSKSSNFTLWRVNNMRKILAEYYDENKILIFATILGCLYYFYRKLREQTHGILVRF